MSKFSDHLVFRDEEMFFSIVQTTPDDIEAEDLLRRAKDMAMQEKQLLASTGKGHQANAVDRLLTRLNDEIKYVTDRRDRVGVREAVRAVFGRDGELAVREWRKQAELENEARINEVRRKRVLDA